jgi:hypothetical protein
MATAMRVEAAVPGRRKAGTAEHPVEIDLDPGPVTVRALVEAVVRAEVAANRERADEQTLVRLLTEASVADGPDAGAVRSGDREVVGDVDGDAAVAAVLLAHPDGVYEIFIDDRPAYDLDGVVTLGADTRLLFVRLVPPADG